jgi:hypothetical protein
MYDIIYLFPATDLATERVVEGLNISFPEFQNIDHVQYSYVSLEKDIVSRMMDGLKEKEEKLQKKSTVIGACLQYVQGGVYSERIPTRVLFLNGKLEVCYHLYIYSSLPVILEYMPEERLSSTSCDGMMYLQVPECVFQYAYSNLIQHSRNMRRCFKIRESYKYKHFQGKRSLIKSIHSPRDSMEFMFPVLCSQEYSERINLREIKSPPPDAYLLLNILVHYAEPIVYINSYFYRNYKKFISKKFHKFTIDVMFQASLSRIKATMEAAIIMAFFEGRLESVVTLCGPVRIESKVTHQDYVLLLTDLPRFYSYDEKVISSFLILIEVRSVLMIASMSKISGLVTLHPEYTQLFNYVKYQNSVRDLVIFSRHGLPVRKTYKFVSDQRNELPRIKTFFSRY